MKSFEEWFTSEKFDNVCDYVDKEILGSGKREDIIKNICLLIKNAYESSAIENMHVELQQEREPDYLPAQGGPTGDGRMEVRIPKVIIEQMFADLFNEDIYPQLLSIEDAIEEVNINTNKRIDGLALAVRALGEQYAENERKSSEGKGISKKNERRSWFRKRSN